MTKNLQNLFALIMSNTTDSQLKKHTSSYIERQDESLPAIKVSREALAD
jgi:hypothetical protein